VVLLNTVEYPPIASFGSFPPPISFLGSLLQSHTSWHLFARFDNLCPSSTSRRVSRSSPPADHLAIRHQCHHPSPAPPVANVTRRQRHRPSQRRRPSPTSSVANLTRRRLHHPSPTAPPVIFHTARRRLRHPSSNVPPVVIFTTRYRPYHPSTSRPPVVLFTTRRRSRQPSSISPIIVHAIRRQPHNPSSSSPPVIVPPVIVFTTSHRPYHVCHSSSTLSHFSKAGNLASCQPLKTRRPPQESSSTCVTSGRSIGRWR
jgi:hypothetical protein